MSLRLSIVVVTHNRAATLARTLTLLASNPHLPHEAMETLVVDNGSTDGTAALLARDFSAVRVLRRRRNEGVSARNHALAVARGQYVLLVDDDSYPLNDAVARSLAYLDAHPDVGAVVGQVVLPDGRLEASALPGITINCAVCLRKRALDEVGYFPTEFFRQAEEYDLSFRLWQAGYRVDRFEDLVYRHEKVGGNRWPGWIHRLDLRNNLILLERYLPVDLRREYRRDWTQRYIALARHAGHGRAARRAELESRWWAWREAWRGRRILSEPALEAIFGLRQQAQAVGQWAQAHGVRRVAIADLSKNVFATWRACHEAQLDLAGVIDTNPAFSGLSYRGLPLLARVPSSIDGVVLSNVNPAQMAARLNRLRQAYDGPILRLWTPVQLGETCDAAA